MPKTTQVHTYFTGAHFRRNRVPALLRDDEGTYRRHMASARSTEFACTDTVRQVLRAVASPLCAGPASARGICAQGSRQSLSPPAAR